MDSVLDGAVMDPGEQTLRMKSYCKTSLLALPFAATSAECGIDHGVTVALDGRVCDTTEVAARLPTYLGSDPFFARPVHLPGRST